MLAHITAKMSGIFFEMQHRCQQIKGAGLIMYWYICSRVAVVNITTTHYYYECIIQTVIRLMCYVLLIANSDKTERTSVL